jgi:hypothetical protein
VQPEAWVGLTAAVVATPLDAWMIARIVRAYRRSRRAPYLVLALGIAGSYATGLAGCVVVGTSGDFSSVPPAVALLCRATMFIGSAASYGLIAPFAATVFHAGDRRAMALALLVFLAATAIGVVASLTEPATVVTPATMSWPLRVPFTILAAGSLAWIAWRGQRAASRMERAVKDAAGRVSVHRMRLLGQGSLAAAIGQTGLLIFPEHGRFDDLRGYVAIGVVMSTALAFVLSGVLTWATPDALRRRWEAR